MCYFHYASIYSKPVTNRSIKSIVTATCYRFCGRRQFFQSGKTLAIERGKGLNQPVMRVAAQRVAQGDWLHVFPEGRVGYAGSMGPFKWGIGKIVCDTIRSGQR